MVDQTSKYLARKFLTETSVDFGVFRFDLVYNFGAAYGMLQDYTAILSLIGVGIIGYLVISLKSLVRQPIHIGIYGCILAGAIGNTMDRLVIGRVTDFINIHIIPVFNVADMCINAGVILYMAHWWLYARIQS